MRSWSRLLVVPLVVPFVLSAGLFGGAACSKKSAPAEQGSGAASASAAPAEPVDPLVAEVLAAFKGFRAAACACTDEACADKVMKEMGVFAQAQGAEKVAELDKKATPNQVAEIKRLTSETSQCAFKLVKR